MRGGSVLPSLIRLHRMCQRRAPHLEWPLSRLAAILEDFPEVSWRMVAGRCLDYIGEREGIRDGPRTLRTFMEREQRTLNESRQPPEPEKDIWVRCIGCHQQFNISAEVRRSLTLGIRTQVSSCRACYEEEVHATAQDRSESTDES
jgi:hypothetical protein